MEQVTDFKIFLTAIVAALTALWGWIGWLVIFLLICMALDHLSGSKVAKLKGEWTSKDARKGIAYKVGMLLTAAVAGIFDIVVQIILGSMPSLTLPFEYTIAFFPLVVVWYILTELGSIIENADDLGADIPNWLSGLLTVSKDLINKKVPVDLDKVDKEDE